MYYVFTKNISKFRDNKFNGPKMCLLMSYIGKITNLYNVLMVYIISPAHAKSIFFQRIHKAIVNIFLSLYINIKISKIKTYILYSFSLMDIFYE